ncbi:putative chemotaxis protein-glutamate methylesterase [Desulfamplus magnetovallimortis]|uniref:protein-glutamate methylesterase n=1 Tax=Desulfamplus magnetovallimortis TaxID=1246637 RepID=A0A1W1H7A6_9BACT|nr:chemotaxis protein CheB [Desulfamplus magnetovallimortis]SLM28316.1 putative chemotaxis protein-glutamate methylesterase [Desulfamplus magnetovallimortis]
MTIKTDTKKQMLIKAVVIGVSAGGFKALHRILPLFDNSFPIPVMIVQHRKAENDSFFVNSLKEKCHIHVEEAIDKTRIAQGRIYIAPGGYHLLVEKDLSLALSVDSPVCYCRPSIDVLFESAADAFGPNIIGIILTGANADGANGIKAIKSSGGITIVQNPKTADVDYMPLAAIKTNAVDHILELDEIPRFVNNLVIGSN